MPLNVFEIEERNILQSKEEQVWIRRSEDDTELLMGGLSDDM